MVLAYEGAVLKQMEIKRKIGKHLFSSGKRATMSLFHLSEALSEKTTSQLLKSAVVFSWQDFSVKASK